MSMIPAAITIENLGKRYTIGHQGARGDGLRHSIEQALRSPVQWIRTRQERKLQQVDFWALKDVSFGVKQGEIVGIIGRNGAGKSTLLKLLSRITVPTEGRIRINGRCASLLEVGTGFHQELTGRENIFLNGAILGMSRAEITRKFDEIVDFSGIEEFLDTPVKRYSSGMYVRLAFAVAAHLEPEILIIDEVLAVGDDAFQKKCLGKMGSFAQSGRTVLFVSHNMDAVQSLCSRAIWLEGGSVHKDGKVAEVVDDYFNTSCNEVSFSCANPDYGLSIQGVVLRNAQGEKCSQFRPGDDLIVEIAYDAQKRLELPYIVVGVQGVSGSCFTANMLLDGCRPTVLEGRGKVCCRFKNLPLFPQSYTVKMSLRTNNGSDMIIHYQDAAYFTVAADLTQYGFHGQFLSRASRSTPVVVPYEWWLPDGTTAAISLERKLPTDSVNRSLSDSSPTITKQISLASSPAYEGFAPWPEQSLR
jgi:lipopolysaccharide transport system ATP-binding protein